jgi:hypothetical protein
MKLTCYYLFVRAIKKKELIFQMFDFALFSLQAHRVVLSACSDYFRAMFTDPMRERSQDEIQLSGIDAEGLELVLEYIYTSKLSLDLSNIQTVLSTATHLQILQVTFLQIDFTRISEYSSILRPKNRVYI